jgi:hypothetical protein
MSLQDAQFILATPGTNWTRIILVAIFALGLVLVVLLPITIDVINAHVSWRKIVTAHPEALAQLQGPNGIQGLARATMSLALLVTIGFGLGYVLVEHPFADNKTIVTAILTALTTAFASVTAFYFSTRAMQSAQPSAGATPSDDQQPQPATADLTVTISSPTDGASFTQNQQVNAAYSVAPSTGAEITQLTGTIDNGAPLDTVTLGQKTLTVSAKDSAGREAQATHTYTVTPAGG